MPKPTDIKVGNAWRGLGLVWVAVVFTLATLLGGAWLMFKLNEVSKLWAAIAVVVGVPTYIIVLAVLWFMVIYVLEAITSN